MNNKMNYGHLLWDSIEQLWLLLDEKLLSWLGQFWKETIKLAMTTSCPMESILSVMYKKEHFPL